MSACGPLFADFFNEPFFRGLLGNGIANVLAVFLGIRAGLWLQHLISKRGSRRQREQMRHALNQTVRANLGTLATAKDHLARQLIPTFSLDLPLLEATAYAKYDVLNDIDLCAAIDHLRFELEHMARQIVGLFNLNMNANAKSIFGVINGQNVTVFDQLYPQLFNSVMVRMPPLEKDCNDVLTKLEENARRDSIWFWQRWRTRIVKKKTC